MCQGGGGRNIGEGGDDSCEMRIQADQSDHGSWTCLLTLAKDYHSTTTYLGMEVALWQSGHDSVSGNTTMDMMYRQGLLVKLYICLVVWSIALSAWQNKDFPGLSFTGQSGTLRP